MSGDRTAVTSTPGTDDVRSQRAYDVAFVVLINLALLVVLLTVRDYGIAFDEEVQHRYSDHVVRYYASGGTDREATYFGDLYLYGGLFELAAGLATRAIALDPFVVRHLLGALAGLICVLGLWKLVRIIGGPRAAFVAGLFLLLTPRFYGEIFINPKDVPFAAGYVWSLYYLARVFLSLPRPAASLLFRAGLAIGIALGVRVGGLILLGYLGLLCGVYALWKLPNTRGAMARIRLLFRLAVAFLVVSAVAWAVMLAFWPWAQQDPLVNPFRALERVTHFPWPGRVLLAGTWHSARSLPWTYAPHFFLVTLPEAILALLGVGVVLGLVSAVKRRPFVTGRGGSEKRAKGVLVAFLLFSVVFPVVYVVVQRSVLYNGIRHLLFVVPPLVGLAALVLEALLRQKYLRRPAGRVIAGMLLIVLWLPAVHGLVHLHPVQYIYFNRLAGGVAGAAGRYDMDYWRASFREAVGLLCRHLEAESGGDRPEDGKVMMGGRAISSSHYFPDYLSVARTPDEVDFVIDIREDRHLDWLGGVRLLAVERYGTDVAIVRDCRARSEPR
jgi:hypothetical protein